MSFMRETLIAMLPPEARARSRYLTNEEMHLMHRLAIRKARRQAYSDAQRGRG